MQSSHASILLDLKWRRPPMSVNFVLDPLPVPFHTSPSRFPTALLPPCDVVAPALVPSEEVLSLDEDEEEVDSEDNKLLLLSSSLPLPFPQLFMARLFSFLALLRSFLIFSLCSAFSSTAPLVPRSKMAFHTACASGPAPWPSLSAHHTCFSSALHSLIVHLGAPALFRMCLHVRASGFLHAFFFRFSSAICPGSPPARAVPPSRT